MTVARHICGQKLRKASSRSSRTCWRVASESAVRHRADRQGVPQRNQSAQFHVPLARVRADGTGIFHPARRTGAVEGSRAGRERVPERTAIELGLGSSGTNIGRRNGSLVREYRLGHDTLDVYWQKQEELAHYASACVDMLFEFPFGVAGTRRHRRSRQLRFPRSTRNSAANRWSISTTSRRRNICRTWSSRPRCRPRRPRVALFRLRRGGHDRDEKGETETRVVMRFPPRIASR